MVTSVVHNVLFGQRARLPLSFLAQNLLILHIFRNVSSHDCHSICFRPCLGSFAPNGFLLASILPHGDTFLSVCLQCSCSFLEQNGFARILKRKNNNNNISHLTVLSDIWFYFILFFPLTAIFGLAASPPHGNRFSICLTAKSIFYSPLGECRFIFLSPPPGEIVFLFASRWMSILYFSCPLTAKSIFYSPHGEIDFLFASRRMSILFFSHRFTAKSIFIHLTANA